MKINYILRDITLRVLISILLLTISYSGFSQAVVKIPFTQRTSQQAPVGFKGKKIYHLPGDFTMLGNANAFLSPYYEDGYSNAGNMMFTKLSNDPPSIKNSSSATLQLPQGVNAECTKIVYAGLYWTGRGDDESDFILSKTGNKGDGMDKRKVKLKIPGGEYEELTSTNIFYGNDASVRGMYAGYADITQLVQTGMYGTYSVADIATFEGSSNPTGYSAGWGMVVVYENTSLKWRDITIFDGFAFIKGSGNMAGEGQLDVSGFTAAEKGNINVKMGVMAGEGDRSITGDYFQIKKVDNSWLKLSHGGNSADNFFNSSIFTSSSTRTPNNTNNFGVDISMFDLPNSGNSIIANKQTGTSFRYGTSGDSYSIFNITFAVDAFVPSVDAFNRSTNGISNNSTVKPGQILDFEVDLTNTGTEAIKNGRVEVMLPPNLHFVSATPILGNNTKVSWSHPNSTDFNATPGGLITWTIPEIPMGSTPKEIVGKLKYKLRVTENCILLTTSSGTCGLTALITGTITGVGANSSGKVEAPFITSYSQGTCNGNPVHDPYRLNIKLDATMINSCSDVVNGSKQFKAYCSMPGNAFSRATVASAYPAGTRFYRLPPGTPNYLSSEVLGDFPLDANSAGTNYYAVIVGMDEKCSLLMSIQLLVVNTQPIANNIKICAGVEPIPFDVQLSEYGKQNNYTLFYFDSAASNTPLASAPSSSTAGTFTYFVAEGWVKNGVLCMGSKVRFNVEIRNCKIITNPMIPTKFKNPK